VVLRKLCQAGSLALSWNRPFFLCEKALQADISHSTSFSLVETPLLMGFK